MSDKGSPQLVKASVVMVERWFIELKITTSKDI
jgi:hypothetical protein